MLYASRTPSFCRALRDDPDIPELLEILRALAADRRVAAAEAYRTGYPCSAASILEVADAAEEPWLTAEGVREFAV